MMKYNDIYFFMMKPIFKFTPMPFIFSEHAEIFNIYNLYIRNIFYI